MKLILSFLGIYGVIVDFIALPIAMMIAIAFIYFITNEKENNHV